MSHLKRTPDGRVIMPTFPALRRQIAAIEAERDWLNNNTVQYLRNIGLEPGAGLTWAIIKKAATSSIFLPDAPKRALQYERFLSFQGRTVFFRKEDFYFSYNLTADGQARLAALKEFEELSPEEQDTAVLTSNQN